MNKKSFFLAIFTLAAILLTIFIRWSQSKITPRVEEIVQDIESNTGDLQDKVEDLVDGEETIISGSMDVGYLNNGLWGASSAKRTVNLNAPEKSTRTISDFTSVEELSGKNFERFIGEYYTSKEYPYIIMEVANGDVSKKYLSEDYKVSRDMIAQASGIMAALPPIFGRLGSVDVPLMAKQIEYPGTDLAIQSVNLIGQAVPLTPRVTVFAIRGDDIIRISSWMDEGLYATELWNACAKLHKYNDSNPTEETYNKAFTCYTEKINTDKQMQDMINSEVKKMLEIFALKE